MLIMRVEYILIANTFCVCDFATFFTASYHGYVNIYRVRNKSEVLPEILYDTKEQYDILNIVYNTQ